MKYTDEMKELDTLIQSNHEKSKQLFNIGNTVEIDGQSYIQVNRDELIEINKLCKEMNKSSERIHELLNNEIMRED